MKSSAHKINIQILWPLAGDRSWLLVGTSISNSEDVHKTCKVYEEDAQDTREGNSASTGDPSSSQEMNQWNRGWCGHDKTASKLCWPIAVMKLFFRTTLDWKPVHEIQSLLLCASALFVCSPMDHWAIKQINYSITNIRKQFYSL